MTWPTALVLVAILAFLALAFHTALKAIHDATRRGNVIVMIASFIAILLVFLLHDHAFAATLDLLRYLLTPGPGTH